MMTAIQDLLTALTAALADPQPSERWAMYRLVAPTVDYAAAGKGWRVYFEFSQASSHGTHQAVDIALLDGERPVVLIEAKRASRLLSPEQIDKYLSSGVRGVVTNGYTWLLCQGGRHQAVELCHGPRAEIRTDALMAVTAFLRGEATTPNAWLDAPQTYRSSVKPAIPQKAQTARRQTHPVTVVTGGFDLETFIQAVPVRPPAEKAFLGAWVQALSAADWPPGLRIEARKSRVVFFEAASIGKGKRLARIELGKRHPDILIRTEVVAAHSRLAALSPPQIHDKGPHMRRFRLADVVTAAAFGEAMAAALRAVVTGKA